MAVTLRNCPSGFLYAGQNSWVNDPVRALDLGTVEDAVEVGFGAMEVVVTFDDPVCSMVLPLARKGKTRGEAKCARSARAVQSAAL